MLLCACKYCKKRLFPNEPKVLGRAFRLSAKALALCDAFQQKRKLDLVPSAGSALKVAAAAQKVTAIHEGFLVFLLNFPLFLPARGFWYGILLSHHANTWGLLDSHLGCMRVEVGT